MLHKCCVNEHLWSNQKLHHLVKAPFSQSFLWMKGKSHQPKHLLKCTRGSEDWGSSGLMSGHPKWYFLNPNTQFSYSWQHLLVPFLWGELCPNCLNYNGNIVFTLVNVNSAENFNADISLDSFTFDFHF